MSSKRDYPAPRRSSAGADPGSGGEQQTYAKGQQPYRPSDIGEWDQGAGELSAAGFRRVPRTPATRAQTAAPAPARRPRTAFEARPRKVLEHDEGANYVDRPIPRQRHEAYAAAAARGG
jgi:hypothetical protein